MSGENTNRERCAPNKTPEHPRDIAELVALVVGNLASHEPGQEGGTVMIFAWRDCAMTVKFPSGRRMYAHQGHGHSLDSTVHELAVGAITEYCQGAGIAIAEIPLCDFGTLDLKSHLITTTADTNNVIPFYMLPTLGGQDIESLISLRGFENYRFRARNAMFVQAEYSLPVFDPFALLLFYDAGNVGHAVGDLSFTHLRQDAGFGVNFRVLRKTILQAYLAGGRGGGLHPGFNLAKQF